MARKRASSSQSRAPLLLGALALLALLVFAGGELFAFLSSDHGRVLLYRHLHLGDRAHVIRLVGKSVRAGLREAGVGPDETRESAGAGGGAAVRWVVRMGRGGSPMQANAAITRAVERAGGVVLSGREAAFEGDGLAVTLKVGLPGFATHEVVLERGGTQPEKPATRGRAAREAAEDEPPPLEAPAVGLVLTGFGADAAFDRSVLRRREPFAIALSAADESQARLLKDSRGGAHEIVLLVPMEPERYPTQNPGPGTLLVSMGGGRIESMTRGYVKKAGHPVAVANFMGSMATQDEPFVKALYAALQKEGLGFLHLSPAPRSVCRELAASEGVAYDVPDALLDAETRKGREKALAAAWDEVIERAARRGDALVVMRATPASLAWLDRALAGEAGAEPRFRLVPPSRVLHRAPGRD